MKRHVTTGLLACLGLLNACGGSGEGKVEFAEAREIPAGHFLNPIVPAHWPTGSADPSVVYHEGHYYYCRSLGDRAIGIAKAQRLQDIGKVPMVTVWTAPEGTRYSRELWAPELQYLQGRWYIYFAASDGANVNHRMYALEADTEDPQRSYTFKGKIADAAADHWAIDGLVIEHENAMYFVWSGWRGPFDGFPQVKYIAAMRNPWTIDGRRHEIAAPELAWEQQGAALIEGPAVLYRDGKIHLAYSASGSWTDDYKLGLLTYSGGDILQKRSWVKSAAPVFAKRPGSGTYGPGHNSFVKSPDGSEDWIVYHAIDRTAGGWASRSVRAQRFTWTADGKPDFGLPVLPGVPIAEPAGSLRNTALSLTPG